MSLVNDLLIEVDRREAEAHGAATSPLEGLAPTAGLRARRAPGRAALVGLAGVVVLALGGLALSGLVTPSAPTPGAEELPAVAAARTPSDIAPRIPMQLAPALAPAPTAAAPAPAGRPEREAARVSVVSRPTSIRALSVVPLDVGVARLVLEADGLLTWRLAPGDAGRRLVVDLEAAIDADPIPARALEGTSIRSVETHQGDGTTRLALAFDAPIRARGSLAEASGRSRLTIDLEAGGPAPPGETAFPTHPVRGAYAEPPPPDAARAPASLSIAPSRDEQGRRVLEQAERRAAEAVDHARFARNEGDLAGARRHYEAALAAVPGHRAAVHELAGVHLELGRPDDAIRLVRGLRREAPEDASLAMLHARLFAEIGNLDTAVELLERSGHNLTQAPELHAMTAAYLQRAGRHAHAAERYETLLRRYPGRSAWWMGLGISLEALGREVEALDVYRIAIQLGELPAKSRRWVSARVEALSAEG